MTHPNREELAGRLIGFAVHDDDCTVNRFPGHDACSCGLSSLIQEARHAAALRQSPSVEEVARESGEAIVGPVQMVSVRFGDIQVNAPMPGFRHHHILIIASYFGHRHGEQGFATADGSFLTREEAAKLALESGQVTKLIAPPNLYSEDCW